jgi:mono/diheme cytochrome c family protein
MMRTVLRWTGRAAGAFGLLLVAGIGAVYAVSEWRVRTTFPVEAHLAAVPSDSATLARGKYLAETRGCNDCHSMDFGGGVIVDDPMVGRLVAANLTPAGRGAAMQPADWELAIRHGVRRDGSALLVMPSQEFQGMTDEDVTALIAYLQSVPPVQRELPGMRLGPLGRALYLAGKVEAVPAEHIAQATTHRASIVMDTTVEFGKYAAAGCVGCHGATLSGGPMPGMPPGTPIPANITPDSATGIGSWSEDDFVRAITAGVRPDGRKLDPFMPVQVTSKLTDVEKRAIYRYLRTVPAKTHGNR